MVRRRILVGLMVLVLSMGWMHQAEAQGQRRWLADPELLEVKGQGVDREGVVVMDMVDARTGWAIARNGLQRFDGRYWRPDQQWGSEVYLDTIDVVSATSGWVGGARVYRTSASLFFARYDGVAWSVVEEIITRQGQLGGYPGVVTDVETFADGTAVALAYSYGDPLLLRYDGSVWRDQTPPTWGKGIIAQLHMFSPSEGWAAGAWEQPNTSERRPVIMHFKDNAWTEVSLPVFAADTFTALEMVSATEGWAVAHRQFRANEACDTSRVLHYHDGAWRLMPVEAHANRPVVAFELIPGINRGWATTVECRLSASPLGGQRMRFDNGAFTPDLDGAQYGPRAYGLLNDEVQYAAWGGAFMRYSAEPLPTERVPDRSAAGQVYFPQTGHSLQSPFLNYYRAHGLNLGDPEVSDRESLALFGYPISERFVEINPDTGKLLEVQYFERARMEYHPQNPEPYKVLLGRLSTTTLNRREQDRQRPDGAPAAECNRYAETGFDLCPPFRSYWQNNGALPVFGFPITQARDEQSQTDGRAYLTQYFERERMEYHPENAGTPYEVLLGLLGSEELRVRGYLPR